jgi:hypothetical protein
LELFHGRELFPRQEAVFDQSVGDAHAMGPGGWSQPDGGPSGDPAEFIRNRRDWEERPAGAGAGSRLEPLLLHGRLTGFCPRRTGLHAIEAQANMGLVAYVPGNPAPGWFGSLAILALPPGWVRACRSGGADSGLRGSLGG